MVDEMQTLQELGLSANEARLYLLLIRSGQMRATELASKSGLQRRTVYDTLAQLEKKGMAGRAEVSGVLTFSPSPPAALLTFLDEKRDAVERILPVLEKPFEQEEKTAVSVTYGTAGMKMVLEDILRTRSDYYVYYGQLQIFDYIPKFFSLFNEKRKHLGVRGHYLLLDIPQARERSKLIPLAEFRFMDPSVLSVGVWWTYADRLVLFVLQKEKEPLTIFIKNADLAKTFRQAFDTMFESSAQVYHGLEGMKAILEQTLKYKETLFIGGGGQAGIYMDDYIRSSYLRRAMKHGHQWRNVAHHSIMRTPAAKYQFHSIRFLPKTWEANPNVIWIYGNCVVNVVWAGPKTVAFLVEDAHVARAYRNYFEMMWKMAEKK